MSVIKFNDGVSIDTAGAYRVKRERDGLYVVGKGFMCPVDTYEEGEKLIEELEGKKR